jgi:WD40 repeat protein
MLDGLSRFLFGYDFFISYAYKDGIAYAAALEKKLSDLDFACFLDASELPPGEQLPASLRRAIHRSKALVLVGTEGAITAPFVKLEVFTALEEKKVIPIDIDGIRERVELPALRELPWVNQERGSSELEGPSSAVIERISGYAQFTRRNAIMQRVVRAAVTVFLLIGLATVWQWRRAVEQRRIATVVSDSLVSQQLIAQSRSVMDAEPDLALLLAVRAFERARDAETQSHLLRVLQYDPGLDRVLYPGHPGPVSVNALAYHPSGARLAAANEDGTISIWDAATGALLGKRLATGLVGASALAFGPREGQIVVAAADSGDLQLWDVRSGQMLARSAPAQRPRSATVAAFSADGRRAAVGSRFDITLWDLEAWRPTGSIAAAGGEVFIATHLAFNADGKRLASADMRAPIQLWDVGSARAIGAPLRLSPSNTSASAVAFAPDGRRLAAATSWIRLWDLEHRTPVGPPLRGHEADVDRLVFSPNGDRLVSKATDALRLWDLDTVAPLGRILRGAGAGVRDVVVSPDGAHIAAGDAAGRVFLWRIDPAERLATKVKASDESVFAVAYTPDGAWLAVADGAGVVRLRNRATGQALGPPLGDSSSRGVYNLAFSPDGRQLAAVGHGDITLWDVSAARARVRIRHGGAGLEYVPAAVYSPDGRVLATGGTDRTVRLWNTTDGTLLRTLGGHDGGILALAFSPDGAVLASGSGDRTVRLWRVATGEGSSPALDVREGPVRALRFLQGGKRLLAVTDSATALWDPRTRELIHASRLALSPEDERPATVTVDRAGRWLAFLRSNGSIRLWRVDTGAPLAESLHPIRFFYQTSFPAWGALTFSPDGRQLAAAALGPEVLLWDVDADSWVKRACRIANRDLTQQEWAKYVGARAEYEPTCRDQ